MNAGAMTRFCWRRNKYIAEIYQDFVDVSNDKNFARVMMAQYLLGRRLFFTNGFNFFYNLAARFADGWAPPRIEIKYINRDELYALCNFCQYHQRKIRAKTRRLLSEDEIYEMLCQGRGAEGMLMEHHIIGDQGFGNHAGNSI